MEEGVVRALVTRVPARRTQAQHEEHEEGRDGDGLGADAHQPDKERAENSDHQCTHHAAESQMLRVVDGPATGQQPAEP